MINNKVIKFMLVGIINSIFGYGCFFVFLYINFHYTAALFLATIAGILFNFKSIGALVFRSHNNLLVFRFIGSYLSIYLINVAGINALSYIGLTPYVAGAVLIVPMAVLAFILNKRFVFSHG